MELSGLIGLLIVLVVCGVVLYLIEALIPMAEPFKIVIRVIVVLVLAIYLLQFFGIWSGGPVLRR